MIKLITEINALSEELKVESVLGSLAVCGKHQQLKQKGVEVCIISFPSFFSTFKISSWESSHAKFHN